MPASPRVLFLGMQARLSVGALDALLQANIPICGVVIPVRSLPGHPGSPIQRLPPPDLLASLPVLNPYGEANLLQLAADHKIPAFALRAPNHAESLATLAALEPDLGCMACFSKRLPPALFNLPQGGTLNVHPARLPQFRGPAPLFWTFRHGITETGVTVHWVDAGLDTGDIALQAPLALPLGISGPEAEIRAAQVGGMLLVQAARRWEAGTLPRLPQPAGPPSDPWPTAADFTLDLSWTAARALHFMRGTAEWGTPYHLEAAGRRWQLARAERTLAAAQAEAVIQQGKRVRIQFSEGVLVALLAD